MIHGVLNVQKEKGYTSHDVVAKLRGIVGQRKIGHTGTLDPDAKGVLPVCLGRATKLCDLLTDKDKTYEAVLLLGCTTDTQDTGGTVLEEQDVPDLAEDTVMDILQSFVGEYAQIPPMYSALKVGGRKLYELARAGKVVERPPRPVTFYSIEILEEEHPEYVFRVECSKGTYIRTLCHDIGQKLGDGAAIIFISANRDMALRGYEVSAARYLAKPLQKAQLREALLYCCRTYLMQKEILLPAPEGQRRILVSDVIYIEPWERGTRLVLVDGECKTGSKISELERLLPKERFVFCHRTLLVNLTFIRTIRYCELTLKNGQTLPVSKYRQAQMKESFMRYLRE